MQNADSISLADLENVTGGATPATTGSSSCNDQLITMMQGLQSSLKDLACNNNQGLFGGQNGALLFMTMAMAMQRRNDVYVVGGGRCGGWYSWRSGW